MRRLPMLAGSRVLETDAAAGRFFKKGDDMINDDERERRLIELLALQVLGLVEHHELPDGSGELYYPQPDHPDVLALRAANTLH